LISKAMYGISSLIRLGRPGRTKQRVILSAIGGIIPELKQSVIRAITETKIHFANLRKY